MKGGNSSTTEEDGTMTSRTEDGGPAFPVEIIERDRRGAIDNVESHIGLSKRDWFAGMALTHMRISDYTNNPHYWERVAMSAYAAADAMLLARNETPTGKE